MNYDKFKTRLEDELLEITKQLSKIATQDGTGDWITGFSSHDNNADPNEVADVTEEWDNNRAVVGELETRYRNLKRALAKFDNGTYGICEISGEPIEKERLEVNPAARTNIANRDKETNLPL